MRRSTNVRNLTSASNAEGVKKAKVSIKSRLPALSPAEVRRYRLPLDEAVVLELKEAKAGEAVEYLQFMFQLDEELRKEAAGGDNLLLLEKPRLRQNRELVEELRKVLSVLCNRQVRVEQRVSSLMETAQIIENSGSHWYWISEVLYRTCFWLLSTCPSSYVCCEDPPPSSSSSSSSSSVDPDSSSSSRLLTTLQYAYAHFLFHKMNKAKVALEYVREAHRRAEQRVTSLRTGQQEDLQESQRHRDRVLLYEDCCALLHQVLMSICRRQRQQQGDDDPELALNSSKVALHIATRAGNERHIAEALLELGKCEAHSSRFQEAVQLFYKSLQIYYNLSDPLCICNLHSQLAITFKEIGDNNKCLKHLLQFKDTASIHQLPFKLAEAHYLIGEFYLTQDNPKQANVNLDFAISIYTRLGAFNESSRVRCLSGVSKGQVTMKAYRSLIMDIIARKSNAVLRMILWKDRGEPL